MPGAVIILTDDAIIRIDDELRARTAAVTDRRLIIGIAGIAGSGKSTLASRLAAAATDAVAIGLDGFHRPNAELHARGLWARKGAPETYNASAFIECIRNMQDANWTGHYPVYDRDVTHDPVWSPDPITHTTRLVLAEGQFLLLPDAPWGCLADLLDETWLLDTPMAVAKDWILSRHMSTGRSAEEARTKYENDRRNSKLVLSRSRSPDRVMRWPDTCPPLPA